MLVVAVVDGIVEGKKGSLLTAEFQILVQKRRGISNSAHQQRLSCDTFRRICAKSIPVLTQPVHNNAVGLRCSVGCLWSFVGAMDGLGMSVVLFLYHWH